MKFKSYYWAIIAAAIVLVLALTLPFLVFRDNSDTSNPHGDNQVSTQSEPVDYAPQIEAFQDLIKANPNDALAIAGLGDVFMQAGRFADASDQYAKAVGINPNESTYYSRLGDSEFALGLVDVAMRDLQKGLVINPNDQEIMLYIGSIYAQTGKTTEARQFWQKAYDANPTTRFGHVAQQLMAEQDNPQANQTTTP